MIKSLSDRAGLLILLNAFKYAVGFFIPVLLVRLLSQNDYGTYQQLLLIASAAVGIMRLGIPTSIYYFFNTIDSEKRDWFVVQTIVLLTFSGVISAVALYGLSPYLAEIMSNPQIELYLPQYCMYILFYLASEHLLDFLINKDKYRLGVVLQVIESIVRILMLILPLLLGYHLYGLVISVVCFAVFRYVLAVIVLQEHLCGAIGHVPDLGLVRSQLIYSMPLAFSSMIGLVGRLLDKALVAVFFGPMQFAIYAVGALEIPVDSIFQSSAANVLRAKLPPLIKAQEYGEVARILNASVRKLALIIFPVFFFLLAFSFDFITLLFTDAYSESVQVFRIYLMLTPLNIFILSMIPQIFGLTRLNMYITFSSVVFNIGASFILLKLVGYLGPALASVATAYFSSTIYSIVAFKLLKCRIRDIIPLVSIVGVVATCLIATGAGRLAGGYIPQKPLRLTCAGLVFVTIYLFTINSSGLLFSGDKELVRRWAAKLPLMNALFK